jgi:hypothetical protein
MTNMIQEEKIVLYGHYSVLLMSHNVDCLREKRRNQHNWLKWNI